MATAHQLHSADRLAAMSINRLQDILRLALHDMDVTNHRCLYAGVDRASTVATATRTRDDVTAALGRKAA